MLGNSDLNLLQAVRQVGGKISPQYHHPDERHVLINAVDIGSRILEFWVKLLVPTQQSLLSKTHGEKTLCRKILYKFIYIMLKLLFTQFTKFYIEKDKYNIS